MNMPGLQLNLPSEIIDIDNAIIPRYREFYGRENEQMPLLTKSGRDAVSAAHVMMRRLQLQFPDASDLYYRIRDDWWENYFDTCDAIACHPDGNAKIILDARQITDLNPGSRLIHGALDISGLYDDIDGIPITRSELKRYSGRISKEEQFISNRIWRILARHPDEVPEKYALDEKLLPEYACAVFLGGRRAIGKKNRLNVSVAPPQDDPVMRLWRIGGLYSGWIEGNTNIDNYISRIVGEARDVFRGSKEMSKTTGQIDRWHV